MPPTSPCALILDNHALVAGRVAELPRWLHSGMALRQATALHRKGTCKRVEAITPFTPLRKRRLVLAGPAN